MANLTGKDPDYDRGPVLVMWEDQGDGTFAKRIVTREYVWDPVGLAWVRGQQALLKTDSFSVSADVTDRSARLVGHVTVDNASIPVTGTFWQATQPVSGTFWQATQPVSGTFFQATQPVSIAAAVDVSDRVGRLLGVVASITATIAANITQIAGAAITLGQKAMANSFPVVISSDQTAVPVSGTVTAAQTTAASLKAQVSGPDSDNATNSTTKIPTIPARANASVPAWTEGNEVPVSTDLAGRARTREVENQIATTISAANTTITLTIGAAGVGLFHYITSIEIKNINPTTTAIATSATTLAYTTTNIPGSPAWSEGTSLAASASQVVERISYPGGIKTTTANTATTFVAPAIGTGGLCRITVTYYIAA